MVLLLASSIGSLFSRKMTSIVDRVASSAAWTRIASNIKSPISLRIYDGLMQVCGSQSQTSTVECIQVRLEVSDVERIDNLVHEHSQLFDNVAEYEGLKRPKHHFAQHVAMDAWRYGPPRGYWCFGFEGFNKVIKKGASLSNWKSETVSIMKYWSLRR